MGKDKTSILFTGDIGFDRYMDRRWEDPDFLSPPVLAFFHSAEHVCVNVEGAMIHAADDGGRGMFFHSMNPEAICALRKMRADLWSIGNNHTMDAGRQGIISTREMAASMGARAFGAGMNEREASQPVYLEEAGGIGIFNVSYMSECVPATADEPGIFRWDDMAYIEARIREIKATCRWCVIVSHGGEEFASLPNPYTRERYIRFLELGADVVVGHHPHVPENYELFENGKAIFYSLGNFIFDTDYQRAHLYTDTGVLLKLIFNAEKLDFEAIGIQISRGEERIDICPLPDIFTEIPAGEYELLAPLNAKAFLRENDRTLIYRFPERFAHADKAVWDGFYHTAHPEKEWDGYSKDAHMDFSLLLPLAEAFEAGRWKHSRLEKVKAYILAQL